MGPGRSGWGSWRAVAARFAQRPVASGVGTDGLQSPAAEIAGDGQRSGHRRRLRGDRRDVLCHGDDDRSFRLAGRVPGLQRPDPDRRPGVGRGNAYLDRTDRSRPERASSLRPVRLVADPEAAERRLHRAQLCGVRILPVPLLLLDRVLFRDNPEGGAGRDAAIFHDDHAWRWASGCSPAAGWPIASRRPFHPDGGGPSCRWWG